MALEYTLAALFAFALSAGLTFQFSRPGSRFYILDHPTGRSLHSQAVPRSGGVAMVLSILLVGGVLCALHGEIPVGFAWLIVALLLVACVGFVDDRRSLSPLLRLFVHGVAGVLVLMGGFVFEQWELPGWAFTWPHGLAVLVTWLFVVWMINLYNFMDGMDGFAGGMTCIGFGSFALIGGLAGDTLFALLSLVIAAAALGFLCFNFPPARIFMGDAGAYSLGLLAAGFTLWGMRGGLFPFWVPVLIFSPFIADATFTLIGRALRGAPVWEAHRTHVYQQLVQAGFGHRKTVLWEYALMFICATAAISGLRAPELIQWLILAGGAFLYVALLVWSGYRAALSPT